jgi:hypothetical protein
MAFGRLRAIRDECPLLQTRESTVVVVTSAAYRHTEPLGDLAGNCVFHKTWLVDSTLDV